MARPIKLTEEIKQHLLQEVSVAASGRNVGRFKFEKDFSYLEGSRTCKILYTGKAWLKTIMLVDDQSKEVGWFGVVKRHEEENDVFVVEDIMVYPQTVTSTTIDSDPVQYAEWMDGLDADTFNHLRLHGHSHVNMGVTPSSADQTYRNDLLTSVTDDSFYVFQIFNKKGKISSEVYDAENNIVYEDADVEVVVECDNMDVWDKYKELYPVLQTIQDIDEQSLNWFLRSAIEVADLLSAAKQLVKEERKTVFAKASKEPYRNGTNQRSRYSRISDPFAYVDESGRWFGVDEDEFDIEDYYYDY